MYKDKTFHWYIFSEEGLLLLEKGQRGTYTIPTGNHPPVPIQQTIELACSEETASYAAVSQTTLVETEQYLPIDLRSSWDYLEAAPYKMAGKAAQLVYWDKHSCFCPVCGTETQQVNTIMKACPSCQYELYPAISTAILVLIRKEDTVLLVRARNFKGPFYGLVAGFLETGETLEECVSREVKEETGLDISHITYFGNQSWPFPSGLMVGFIADYAGGEIQLQEEELMEAGFFHRENLPELPRRLSLARKMIDWWIENPQ